ncbi:hypothetical protein, partial [Enterobacter asburiae]|uniref:hypothetical protein n=1 Tax=Enterobacter asburiae TaxID=61645 RepID=UPI00209A7AEB
EAVNGHAIYCGVVSRWQGVGAASPDKRHLWCRVCAVLQMHIRSGCFATLANRLWPQNMSCPLR